MDIVWNISIGLYQENGHYKAMHFNSWISEHNM
jgi:hypothetical protein